MSRRDNAHARCLRCRMHQTLCICGLLPSLWTSTHLVLFIHHREDKKTTNTGRLATLCLPNSHVVVRGRPEEPTVAFAPDPARQNVLLFPEEGAAPLAQFAHGNKPVTLVVPDGTWRQAASTAPSTAWRRDRR